MFHMGSLLALSRCQNSQEFVSMLGPAFLSSFVTFSFLCLSETYSASRAYLVPIKSEGSGDSYTPHYFGTVARRQLLQSLL